jgi:hypothetical protein
MQLSRRSLITGLASFIAAPAIVRVSSLMPVKAWVEPTFRMGTWQGITWHDIEAVVTAEAEHNGRLYQTYLLADGQNWLHGVEPADALRIGQRFILRVDDQNGRIGFAPEQFHIKDEIASQS